MRSRNYLMLVGLIAICSLGLAFVGCGDDDDSPTVAGDNTDLYGLVQTQVNSTLETAVGHFANALSVAETIELDTDGLGDQYVDTLGDRLLGPAPLDSGITPQGDGWWAIYSTDLQAGITTIHVDSIRWLDGGTPITDAGEADALDFRRHYSTSNSDTSSTYADKSYSSDLHITGIDGSTATITGTVSYDLQSKLISADSSVWQSYDVDVEITGMGVGKLASGWGTGCPTSGTATITVAQTYKKNSGAEQTVNWTISVTFTNGTAAYDVTNDAALNADYEASICSM
ncbi:hypothetical protein GF377_09810 [candidate division GN15 bacterium]|nr:hypothetical protein [candidate division GN15 bacterium]